MNRERKYTTAEVAAMLGVSYATINNWIRKGKLSAYQTPGGHRRVTQEELLKFLKIYEMPVPPELSEISPVEILVVDDEKSFLAAVKRWFHRFTDYKVTTTHSPIEALLIAGESRPALMLLDILMPGMDGIEVCKAVKSRPRTKDICVIGISGKADPMTRQELLAAGAVECLDKTTPLDELALLVDKYMANSRGRRSEADALSKDGAAV